MTTLKSKLSKVLVVHFYGHGEKCIQKDKVKEVIFISDVRECFKDFNNFFKTIGKENSVFGLNDNDRKIIIDIMDKYNIDPVERNISSYEHVKYIHKKIFGDFE